MKPKPLLLCAAALAALGVRAVPVRADPAGSDHVVELPPLLVSDEQNPLDWRYGAAPGIEVLSLCPDATTRSFIEQFCRLRELLELVLPDELQVAESVPMVHLLGAADMGDRLKQDVQVEMFQGRGSAREPDPVGPLVGRGFAPPRVRVLPNLRLMDTDAYTIFALLDDAQVQDGRLTLTPDYVSFLLQRRAPPLPAWFVVGTMSLFTDLSFEERSVAVAPFTWISDEETRAVRRNPGAALLPLEDLLGEPRPPAGPPAAVEAYRKAWVAEAGLLARWALDGRTPGERQAYFAFVGRACTAPVTAAGFQACFGLSPAAARDQLARYLPTAADRPLRLQLAEPRPAPDLRLRPAAPAESARIKGDWERMETGFVKRNYPALSGKYLDQARRTLHRAYDLGERDPRLLATMGLTECDAGDDAAAQPLLAAAVVGGVVRPRAYYELARILYARALAQPAGAARRLSSAQTTAVVEPLLSAQRLSPPLAAAGELFAELWFHSEATPLPSDLVQLNQATGCFPKDYILGYETALLDAQAGHWPEARGVVGRALRTAAAPAVRAKFEQLQALFPSPPPAAPAPAAPAG
jgi:hypothetical protein